MTIRPTCLNCPDRVIGCHGKCELYQAARADQDTVNEREQKEKRVQRDADEVKADGIRKVLHRKKARKDVRYLYK